jgi:hypothetical protein
VRLRPVSTTFLSFCVATAAAVLPLHANETATGFICTFKAGTTLSYADAKFKRAVAKPLSFEIAAIDLNAQSAALVTAKGRGEVKIVRALNANHFLEVVAEGFLNITTIYDRDAKAAAHPAVHSRHFGLFGEPVVAQYQGFCTPK